RTWIVGCQPTRAAMTRSRIDLIPRVSASGAGVSFMFHKPWAMTSTPVLRPKICASSELACRNTGSPAACAARTRLFIVSGVGPRQVGAPPDVRCPNQALVRLGRWHWQVVYPAEAALEEGLHTDRAVRLHTLDHRLR